MSTIEFGPEQIKIMRVLWEKKKATAQDIADALSETEPTKLVNVQMILKRLVEKNAVSFDVRNREYVYYPIVNNKKVVKHAVKRFVDHIFAGSVDDLVSFILNNEKVSPEVLEEIGKRIKNSGK